MAATIKQKFDDQVNFYQKYNLIDETFSGFHGDDQTKGHTMPLSVRRLIQAQCSARTVEDDAEGLALGDNRSRRIIALMAGTVGVCFSLVARTIRTIVFTAFFFPALLIRFSNANRYDLEGAVPELLKKYGEEWIDLGLTLASIPLGLCKAISPLAFEGATDSITDYYLGRADRRRAFAERETEKRNAYDQAVQAAERARDAEPAAAADA